MATRIKAHNSSFDLILLIIHVYNECRAPLTKTFNLNKRVSLHSKCVFLRHNMQDVSMV